MLEFSDKDVKEKSRMLNEPLREPLGEKRNPKAKKERVESKYFRE